MENKKNYGIEFEFFVLDKDGVVVPAYTATPNLDGNPVIGEIKTGVHNSIVDCVFELKKLIYLEKTSLETKGFTMDVSPKKTVSDDFLKSLRQSHGFVDSKHLEVLKELSVYPNGRTSRPLRRQDFTASLQINFSQTRDITVPHYELITVEDKHRYEKSNEVKSHSVVFDYLTTIFSLDESFRDEIDESHRVKGVYAIKDGILGDRIEYRSLPNNIDLDKIITKMV